MARWCFRKVGVKENDMVKLTKEYMKRRKEKVEAKRTTKKKIERAKLKGGTIVKLLGKYFRKIQK